jgi:hypothetical protein
VASFFVLYLVMSRRESTAAVAAVMGGPTITGPGMAADDGDAGPQG